MNRNRTAMFALVLTVVVVSAASALAFHLQPGAGQVYVAGTGTVTAALLMYGAGGLAWISSTVVPLLSRGIGIISTVVVPIPILIVTLVNASRDGWQTDYAGHEFAGVSACFPIFLWIWGGGALAVAYILAEREPSQGRPGKGFHLERW